MVSKISGGEKPAKSCDGPWQPKGSVDERTKLGISAKNQRAAPLVTMLGNREASRCSEKENKDHRERGARSFRRGCSRKIPGFRGGGIWFEEASHHSTHAREMTPGGMATNPARRTRIGLLVQLGGGVEVDREAQGSWGVFGGMRKEKKN